MITQLLKNLGAALLKIEQAKQTEPTVEQYKSALEQAKAHLAAAHADKDYLQAQCTLLMSQLNQYQGIANRLSGAGGLGAMSPPPDGKPVKSKPQPVGFVKE